MTAAKAPTRGEVQVALGLTAALLFGVVVLLTAVFDGARRFDFSSFYTAGVIIRQGNGPKLYDLGEQAQIERQLFHRENPLIYLHPPFEALGFAALARLSYVQAYVLWGAINVLLWLFFQHLQRPYTPIPRNSIRYFWLCSLFFPFWVALFQGQTSVLLLLLFSLTFVCLKRGQDFRAGVFLGLGLGKFALVLPFALICLLRSKWRLMAGFAVAASSLGILSLIAVGPAGVRSYTNLLIDTVRNPDNPIYRTINAGAMPNVKGVFVTLLGGRLSTAYISVLAAAVSAPLVFFVAWRWRQEDKGRGRNTTGLMFAAALVVSLITAPYLFMSDLTLMLLAVLLVIGSSPWSEKSGQRVVLTAIMVMLYCPPLYVLLLERQAISILVPVLGAFALAASSLARKPELPLT
jgi:hypothetical protein